MMLECKQDDTDIELIVTLTENISLTEPNFLFVFTHILTKDVIAFVMTEQDDESNYPNRYNQFTIDPSTLFAGYQPGVWNYTVYEQVSSTNTDPTLTGAPVEYGQLLLNRATDFAFTKYDSPTSFKTYNG
jgi:hypothetical protein